MKPSFKNPLLSAALLISATLPALAADLYWDADGDTTTATGGFGIWHTTNTWRDGSDIGTLGNWADGTSPYNTAVFGGTLTAAGNIDVQSNVTVNQIKFLIGGNAPATNYNIGYTGSVVSAGTLTFGGSYDATTPCIDASALIVAGGATVSAKITGTITGGLVIKANNNMFAGYTTGTCGRIYLRENSGNDFIGDVTMLSGSLLALSNLGAPANKIILAGGGLYGNDSIDRTYDLARDIQVTADSALGSFAGGTNKTVIMKLAAGKTISGSGNLTRYRSATALGSGCKEEVWLIGDMSGYTGTFENNKGDTFIQTAATSAGAWKLTGGTIKLDTTNDTHIADGPGASDLLMNGGTLNMNGKNETINGLDGFTGTVQNQLAATTSTLTLGAGDATASFGGVIRNNTTSGGKMALVKTGSGTQTLAGANFYTGDTTVTAGALTLAPAGSLRFAPTTTGVSNKLTGAGTANLNGTLNLDLNAAVATVGNSWTLVDVATANYALAAITSITPALTFTKAGSLWTAPGGPVNWEFNQTTGVLSVVAANTYANWLTANSPATGFITDSDNDGVPNGVENVLGTNPNTSSAGLTEVSATASTAIFKHTLNPTVASDVTYTYEWSTDLTEWKASGGTNAGTTTATITPSTPVSGVVTVTTAITSGPAAKLFSRIKAIQP